MSSYAEAQQLIREAAETQAEELRLSDLDKFPPELFELQHLRSLGLWNIRLRDLPSELAQLSNLQSLVLMDCPFETLPQAVCKLTNLHKLSIWEGLLRRFPPELGQLTKLRGLFVEFTYDFEGLPPEIGQLIHLEELVINCCEMRAFIPEICQLTNLRVLWLRGNNLQALPAEIGQLTKLQLLDVNYNELKNIPPEIDQLTDPDLALDLLRNPLTQLPERGPSHLKRLAIGECDQLTRLPDWLREVKILDIHNCVNLIKLPEHLRITESLDLADSGLTTLPATSPDVQLLWRGVPVSYQIAFEPHTISPQQILDEPNAEVRRVMLERVGFQRFIEEANAKELDRDLDPGGVRRLLRVDQADDEPYVGLAVIDPSTGRQYVLRVPPTMTSCHQAAAWVAGFDDPDAYCPLVET